MLLDIKIWIGLYKSLKFSVSSAQSPKFPPWKTYPLLGIFDLVYGRQSTCEWLVAPGFGLVHLFGSSLKVSLSNLVGLDF